MKKDEVIVIDDVIDIEYQEKIKNVLIGDDEFNELEFPWFYLQDVTTAYGDPNSQNRPALIHLYVGYHGESPGMVGSLMHDLFIPLLQQTCHRIGKDKVSILQGRSFLQFPLNLKNNDVDLPHIDIDDRKHFVILYYVCDSDGDTIIYNEREESREYTIKQKVAPKQGRVVIFDGGLMHTAEQPKDNVRCVVNYDLE